MKYNFDKILNRRGTSSIKWDAAEKIFGQKDLLPLWVADMDFEVAPPVKQALRKRIEHGIFGYTFEDEEYHHNIITWIKKRHGWETKREWFSYLPGVVPGLSFAIQAFTDPGDNVIIQPPVYKPFFDIVKSNDRKVVTNPLTLREGKYHFDKKDLLDKIDERTKMLILCSPHNPVGKVWKRKELKEIAGVCLDNDILIVSDEIHFDIVFEGHQHSPLASLSEEISNNTIMLSSPAKTFNLQGLQSAYSIIPNDHLRRKFKKVLHRTGIFMNNTLSIEATKAAYGKGEDWVHALIPYLQDNRDFLNAFLEEKVPEIDLINPEGTYIAWLDCRKMNMNSKELSAHFLEKAGLALVNGADFGAEGEGFMRINIGCSRELLAKALEKIQHSLHSSN